MDAYERRQEALQAYQHVITVTCPECGAPPGQLCDTPAVWVHFERFQLADPETYNMDQWLM